MRVHVLHHATCFDGAASAALFAAFFRAHGSPDASFRYIPKQHRRGDPYQPADFEADEVVSLDFRYTREARLTWFFDHHVSAFQLPGERDHFESDQSGKKFHDPDARSCAGFIATTTRARFGFDPSPHQELLHWADVIDSAAFPGPDVPVALEAPALKLMTFIENNRNEELAGAFIEDLLRVPLDQLAEADYVLELLEPTLELHRADIELLRTRCEMDDGVIKFNLIDQPARAYNKFIPYYHYPKARYLVGLTMGPDGQIKLVAGYNPWLPAAEREHHIARLFERFGGGGHPYVGGAAFAADDVQSALHALAHMVEVLKGAAR